MSESEMHEDPTSNAVNTLGVLNFIYDYRESGDCSAPQNDERLILSSGHEGL
jgi:hypothetical protein